MKGLKIIMGVLVSLLIAVVTLGVSEYLDYASYFLITLFLIAMILNTFLVIITFSALKEIKEDSIINRNDILLSIKHIRELL